MVAMMVLTIHKLTHGVKHVDIFITDQPDQLNAWSSVLLDQPTKKLTKGGVLCKRETSSLARFDHFCVLNALLEMVNGALKQ
jgi:hypothetical protein